MRRCLATATAMAIILAFVGYPIPPAVFSQQAKKEDPKKAKDAPRVIDPINPSGEPKPSTYKSISGPKVCLGYDKGEWTVQLRPGEADWTPIDGWIEVEGGELTKVTGFNDLETAGTGKSTKHADRGKFTKRRIEFDLWVKSGGFDSFRFATSEEARSIRFRFRIGQKLAASERIVIGKDGKHPSGGEFSLTGHPDEKTAKKGVAPDVEGPSADSKAKPPSGRDE